EGVIKNGLMGEHLKAIGFTIVLSVVATVIIGYLLKFTIGLKASAETESLGLDISEHGEEGYNGFQTFVE
ncbi:MAG TPA: ammonia channel protein, partial [Turneriella sp.]|nr:ammonia channel protein [Turneriella sp.]